MLWVLKEPLSTQKNVKTGSQIYPLKWTYLGTEKHKLSIQISKLESKIVISLNMCFGCSKENETVLLSTHNICFG